jgi:hypothetical protein
MEAAIIWGWLLTMQAPGMPPIVDVNYKTEEECELVKGELAPRYPNYAIFCTPTLKPAEVKKAKARKRTATRSRTRR